MVKIKHVVILLLIAVASFVFLGRSFTTDGMFCAVLDVDGVVPGENFAGRIVEVSDHVQAKITAVTTLSVPAGALPGFRVHVSIYCRHSSHFSLSAWAFESVFLASSSQVADILRGYVGANPFQGSSLSSKASLLP